jgi:hypothetical protein
VVTLSPTPAGTPADPDTLTLGLASGALTLLVRVCVRVCVVYIVSKQAKSGLARKCVCVREVQGTHIR